MIEKIFVSKNFFLLWSGRIISQIGDRFYGIALAWWILARTNSPIIMGGLMTASTLPGLIIGPITGALVDRWNRKAIIVFSDIIRGVFVLIIAYVSYVNRLELWHIFSAAVIISTSSAFFDPAVQAIVPHIISNESLTRANALNQMVSGFVTIIGPALGAASVGFFGFTWVFFINGVSYLISAVFEIFMIVSYERSSEGSSRFMDDVWDGFKFLAGKRKVIIIIAIIGICHLFVGCLSVSLPFLAKQLGGNSIQYLGNMEMLLGLGVICASLYIQMRAKESQKFYKLFLCIIALGFSFLFMGIVNLFNVLSPIPYFIVIFVIGAIIGNASTFWQYLLQIYTPDYMAGRVFSVSSLVGNTSLPISYMLTGMLLNYTHFRNVIILSGLSLTLIGALLVLINMKEKSLEEQAC